MADFFTDTMTIYNHYETVTGDDAWQRTVIDGVQWRRKERVIHTNAAAFVIGMVESITIPDSRCGRYVEPCAFKAGKGTWTLNTEDGMDYVVLGTATESISSIHDLIGKYPTVVTVKEVSDNRNRKMLKHIKVVAE